MNAAAKGAAPKRGRGRNFLNVDELGPTPLYGRIERLGYAVSMISTEVFLADVALGSDGYRKEYIVSAVQAVLLELKERLEDIGSELEMIAREVEAGEKPAN